MMELTVRLVFFFAPEAVSHQKRVLVTDPFRLWTSQSSVFERHEIKSANITCILWKKWLIL